MSKSNDTDLPEICDFSKDESPSERWERKRRHMPKPRKIYRVADNEYRVAHVCAVSEKQAWYLAKRSVWIGERDDRVGTVEIYDEKKDEWFDQHASRTQEPRYKRGQRIKRGELK